MPCTQRFSYTRCVQRYTNLYMLSLILIFAPLHFLLLQSWKEATAAWGSITAHKRLVRRSSLFLELSRVLSEVNLTPSAGLQWSEHHLPFPGDPFTVPEFESAMYHQPWPGAECLMTRPSTNLEWSYSGSTLSWSSSLLLPAWEDELPPESVTDLSSALPAAVAHLPLLL